MTLRRVFILYYGAFFAQGLRGFLSNVPGLEAVGTVPAEEEQARVWKDL